VLSVLAEYDGGTARDLPALDSARDEIDEARLAVARAFTALRQSIELERNDMSRQIRLLDRLSDGVLLVGDDGAVVYANVAAASLVGGRNPIGGSFISAVRDHELSDLLHECLRTGSEFRRMIEFPGEGQVVNAVIARVSTSPSEALVLMRDVTELTRLQTLRRDFVANVSHELRTPLSTIKILTETLIDLTEDGNDQANFLQKIDAEVDSMTELVEDLLQLTQLESGRTPLRRSMVSAAGIIGDVRERMLPIAERQGVRLVAGTPGDGTAFSADERRVKQALINLVHNGIVHTPRGGVVELSCLSDEREIVFTVADSGVGIPQGDLERIWERFYKVDRSRARPGSGLGLAIVKHVVQAHGGTVSARSTVGEGSTFELCIPRIPARSTAVLVG
jgi:two-component system phosphate regulon sensor histidine kinase PhoR